MPTARSLDSVAEQLIARIGLAFDLDLTDLPAVVSFVLDDDTLTTLLELPENARQGFKPYRTAPRNSLIDVDRKALLMDWVAGIQIQDLADRHLSAVREEYRSEALAEYSASVFEHHLPWTLGIVLQWANARLEASGSERLFPEHLPEAIHYGVNTKTAIDLMRGGIRSRRLANAVATHADDRTNDSEPPLRDWLAGQSITHWREVFGASPAEVADLLSFARTPGARVVSSVLGGAAHEVVISAIGDAAVVSASARLMPQPDEPDPAPIQVVTDNGAIGTIRLADHEEVSQLLSTGMQLDVTVVPGTAEPTIAISLAS